MKSTRINQTAHNPKLSMTRIDREVALLKKTLGVFYLAVASLVVSSAATTLAQSASSTLDIDPIADTQILNNLSAFQDADLNWTLRAHGQLHLLHLRESKSLQSRANKRKESAKQQARRRKRQAGQQTTKQQPAARGQQPGVTRVVAVNGQTIEFQCPLASELLELGHANSELSSSSPVGGGSLDQNQLRIIWRKDGQPLSQMNSTRLRLSQHQNSSNLTILQAQSRLDEATYECALEQQPSAKQDFANSTKVHQFQLKLIVPPRLAPFEFPSDAQVGMKVLLTCSALEGQQPISFVWLRDNQIIEPFDSSSSSRSADPKEPHRNQVESTRSSVSSLSQLHQQQLADKFALSAHSTISLSDQSEYVIIGQAQSPAAETAVASKRAQRKLAQDAAAANDANGQRADHEQLELDELELGRRQKAAAMQLADSSIRIRQADDYSILSIEPLELKHSGRYTCSAQNEAARVSHSSQLIINAPPTLTTEPKDGDLVSGQSIVIDCAASGQPRPTLSWLRARESNGGKQWDFVPIYENLRYAILSNGSLAINNVTQREQGFYMCSAKNGFGTEVTKLIKITVHEPARISSKFKLVEARVDEQAQLHCEVEGEPPLTLVWLDRDGKPIDKNDKRFIIDDSQPPPQTTPETANRRPAAARSSSSSSSSLIIARATRPDSGHYTCQASNRHGHDKMVVNLLVQDVPDKVNELKVTNVTSSTISLRWQLGFTGNAPVSSYLIQYQSDDPLDDLLMSVAKSNQAASTLAAAAVAANNAAGDSTTQPTNGQDSKPPFSRLYDHLFRSSGEEKQQQQQLQQTSSIKAALETLNSLSATLSDLSITSADEAIDRTLVELTVEQTATSTTIKELSPFCVYRLRLAGINKIGLGEFSDWIRAKTEEAPPSGSALKISASATGPNSVKLTWFPPDRRTWNGQLVRFQIGYRPIDSTYELNKSIEWSPPTLMQSIMLDVDQNKRKQLQANSNIAPTAVVRENNDNKRASSAANVSLAAGRSENGDETANSPYALRQHLRQLLAMQQQELVAHLTNLQRSTTYLVWIQAVNGRGVGPQSHAVSVRTLDDVPPSAPALRVQSSSTNSITISWSMLSTFLSPANQYSLFYRRVPPPPSSSQPQATPPFRTNQLSAAIGNNGNNRQQLSSANASLMTAAQVFSDQLAPFNEPGPFLERTISGQQLVNSNQYHHQPPLHAASNFRLQATNDLDASHQQFVYTLDQLECGSIYELYMTTRNSVGKSEPSAIVTTRTLGEPPLAPSNKNSLFTRIGAQDVLLNLASWSTGGCPLTHVQVRYKQLPQPTSLAATSTTDLSSNATGPTTFHSAKSHPPFSVVWPVSASVPSELLDAINHHHQQPAAFSPSSSRSYAHLVAAGSETVKQQAQPTSDHQQAQFALKSLQPSTGYELEIVAHNAAGHTTAQYEFVTAGPNGTRSGYTRREGVFRLDQRGQPIETSEFSNALEPSSAFTLDHHPNNGHQQSFQASNATLLQQLVPLVLILLCFICLIISSAFCYHRLAITWKQQRAARRHSIDGFRSICSGGSSSGGGGGNGCGGEESHLAGPKLAGIQNWSRLNGTTSREQQRRLHSELVVDQSPSSVNTSTDSQAPVNEQGFHYCLRDSNGAEHQHQQQHVMSATLNPKSVGGGFSQSVSMRDFNALPTGTLNLAKNRLALAASKAAGPTDEFVKIGATLARGRRAILDAPQAQIPLTEAHHYGNVPATNAHRACRSSYGPVLNGVCKHKLDQIYDLYGSEQQHASCNYQLNHHHTQSLETSWTTTNSALTAAASTNATTAVGDHDHHQHPLTNYAIPANYQHQIDVPMSSEQNQTYSCDELYGQGTIDACIQHLMHQQYQQEQAAAAAAAASSSRQQLSYATMLNRHQSESSGGGNQQSRCQIYGEPDGSSFQADTNNNQFQQEQAFEQQPRIGHYTLNAATQSVIESSSGSSGIGMDSLNGGPNQLDSVSTTNLSVSTAAANNRNYAQQTDQQQQQQQTSATEMASN